MWYNSLKRGILVPPACRGDLVSKYGYKCNVLITKVRATFTVLEGKMAKSHDAMMVVVIGASIVLVISIGLRR